MVGDSLGLNAKAQVWPLHGAAQSIESFRSRRPGGLTPRLSGPNLAARVEVKADGARETLKGAGQVGVRLEPTVRATAIGLPFRLAARLDWSRMPRSEAARIYWPALAGDDEKGDGPSMDPGDWKVTRDG